MDPFIAEVRIFGGNFAPTSWALCNGQLLPISQNTALFSLLGTMYGGNGQTTFALPDFRDRVPLGVGQGPGLSNYDQGEVAGAAAVTLTTATMAAHQHLLSGGVGSDFGEPTNVPAGNLPSGDNANNYFSNRASPTLVAMGATGGAGGNQPHNNMMPYLGITFIICLQGVFPSRS